MLCSNLNITFLPFQLHHLRPEEPPGPRHYSPHFHVHGIPTTPTKFPSYAARNHQPGVHIPALQYAVTLETSELRKVGKTHFYLEQLEISEFRSSLIYFIQMSHCRRLFPTLVDSEFSSFTARSFVI